MFEAKVKSPSGSRDNGLQESITAGHFFDKLKNYKLFNKELHNTVK
jgi:hypothetical protein